MILNGIYGKYVDLCKLCGYNDARSDVFARIHDVGRSSPKCLT